MATIITARMVAIVVAAVVFASYSVSAQSPFPAPSLAPSPAINPCLNALLNMSDCLSYVTDGSKQSKPDKACCPEVAGLVESNPICLCELLGNPDALTMGIKIDLKKAINLPKVCGVSTPPISTCSAIGVPVSLPPNEALSPGLANSPSGNSATSPSGSTAAVSPSGSASVSPSGSASATGNHDNGVSSINAALPFLLSLGIAVFSIIF